MFGSVGCWIIFHENNNLARLFKTAIDLMPTDTHKIVISADKTPPGQHVRWPTANPVRFRQSRIKVICLFYPPSFIPIPPLQVFSKISPPTPTNVKRSGRDLK